MYPECAKLQILIERYDCCDAAVQSNAGRQFCYADTIHPEGFFDECQLEDFALNFQCCDSLAEGDLSYAYDCKLSVPGPGYLCSTDQECKESYKEQNALLM